MKHLGLLAALVAAFAFSAPAQILGGSTAARKVVNNACTDGQVPTYSNGRMSGCGSASGGTAGTGINITSGVVSVDSAVTATRDIAASGIDTFCLGSNSATAITCTPTTNTGPGSASGKALVQYTDGMRVLLRTASDSTGVPTLSISILGARNITASDGSSAPALLNGREYLLVYNGTPSSGSFRVVGGGASVSVAAPYLLIAGQRYIGQTMFAATLPPTAGGGGWTVRGGSGTPTLTTTANGALVLTPASGGIAGQNQLQARAIGSNRTLTIALIGQLDRDTRCVVGVGRNGSGAPLIWYALDNRDAGPAPYQSIAITNSSWQLPSELGPFTSYSNGVIQYIRIQITGGNVLVLRSIDGFTWTTFAARTETDTFGGAATTSDEWVIGATTRASSNPSCTILSWQES